MTDDRELARRVVGLTVALAILLAGVCGLVRGPGEAAGVLLGSAVTLVNFVGLRWAAAHALRGVGAGSRARGRPLLWLGASGARLGLVAFVVAVAAAQGWVGVRGLLVSLTLLPVTVVVTGLRVARTT